MRLRAVTAVTALVLAAGAAATFVPFTSPVEDGADAPTSGAARRPERRRDSLSLLYMRGARLHRLDLRTGGDEVLHTLPPAEVHAAPASAWLALVTAAPTTTDFAADPRLSLLHPDSGRRRRLGPGFAPLWRPDGDALAYLRPVEERSCDAETCSGRVEVVTVGISGDPETLLGPGHWTLLAWAGSRLLLGERHHPGAVTIAGGRQRSQRLPLAPAELWGASPDGRWVVVSRPRGAAFIGLDQAAQLGPPLALAAGGRLAEGAWSPHSDTLAGVVLRGVEDGVPSSRVVLSSPEGGTRALRGSTGAASEPLWSADGRSIAFSQAVGKAQDRLRARVCLLASSSCRSWLNWTDEVRLLRLE